MWVSRGVAAMVVASAATFGLCACGGGDDSSGNGGAGGAGLAAGGGTPIGGAPSAGGADMGGTGGAGTAGASSGDMCAQRGGTPVASGACYVPCTYDPGAPPRYEVANGPCTKMGWRCSAFQYCDPNIHCQVDSSCSQIAGTAGLTCVPTGPLQGECALSCQTDADCPKNTTAPSPYVCKPIDTGSGVIQVCRF